MQIYNREVCITTAELMKWLHRTSTNTTYAWRVYQQPPIPHYEVTSEKSTKLYLYPVL